MTVHIDCSHHQAVIHPPQTLSILHCKFMTYHQTLSWPLWSLQVSLSSPSFQCSQALTSRSQFDGSPLITRNSPARAVTSVKWRWFPQTHFWHYLALEFTNLSPSPIDLSTKSISINTYVNHNVSKADVLLFSCDPLPWLKGFECFRSRSGPEGPRFKDLDLGSTLNLVWLRVVTIFTLNTSRLVRFDWKSSYNVWSGPWHCIGMWLWLWLCLCRYLDTISDTRPRLQMALCRDTLDTGHTSS